MNPRLLLTCTLTLAFCAVAHAQDRAKKPSNYPPQLEGAKVEVYKKIGDLELNIYIYNPAEHKPTDNRPVAVPTNQPGGHSPLYERGSIL